MTVLPAISLHQRFDVLDMGHDTPCWVWTGCTNDEGYGYLQVEGRRCYVHRVSYMLFVGPIHRLHEVDHLCRVHSCLNPQHLEAVPSGINSARGQHPNFVAHIENRCTRGHDLTLDGNAYRFANGRVRCRVCHLDAARARRAARKRARQGVPPW